MMNEDWINDIRAGYERGNQVFQRILDTFLRDHKTTVIMYWILFLVGLGLFIAGSIRKRNETMMNNFKLLAETREAELGA